MSSIHVCPLCHDVADYSDDYGWSPACDHPPYDRVEPVEVEGTVRDGALVFALPDPEEWKRTVGAALLDEEIDRAVARINWVALSCDERVAERARQEEMAGPRLFMADALMRQMMVPMYSLSEMVTYPCPRCEDVACENARTVPNPNYIPPDFWKRGFTVRVGGGSTA